MQYTQIQMNKLREEHQKLSMKILNSQGSNMSIKGFGFTYIEANNLLMYLEATLNYGDFRTAGLQPPQVGKFKTTLEKIGIK